ncbi:MAG: hypothetical protein PHW73_00570 [Atribacterota bacterium]|nr:hypothetical protein [Atribacterota bacterium]
METLFNDSEVFTKDRPLKLTVKQRGDFFLEKAKEIIENNWSNTEEEIIADDLNELDLSSNGYELAKHLEERANADYSIDVEFCEWLEDLGHYIRLKVEKNVKAWVKAHNITPKFHVNTKLNVIKDFGYSFKSGDIIYITGIYPQTAQYVLHENPSYRGGTIINFEIVEECCTINS